MQTYNNKGEKSPESKRQEAFRARKKAAGFVRVEEWVTPAQKQAIMKIIRSEHE